MAQKLVVTVNHNPFLDGRMPEIVILDWTADASGNVALPVASTYAKQLLAAAGNNPSVVQPVKVRGELALIETIPGALGVPATNPPTAAYNATITDKYACDITQGVLTGISDSAAQQFLPKPTIQIDSELTLNISGAGANRQGRIICHLKESENRP
jgi:hypothetical protein